jgi:hypothetical protein
MFFHELNFQLVPMRFRTPRPPRTCSRTGARTLHSSATATAAWLANSTPRSLAARWPSASTSVCARPVSSADLPFIAIASGRAGLVASTRRTATGSFTTLTMTTTRTWWVSTTVRSTKCSRFSCVAILFCGCVPVSFCHYVCCVCLLDSPVVSCVVFRF